MTGKELYEAHNTVMEAQFYGVETWDSLHADRQEAWDALADKLSEFILPADELEAHNIELVALQSLIRRKDHTISVQSHTIQTQLATITSQSSCIKSLDAAVTTCKDTLEELRAHGPK